MVAPQLSVTYSWAESLRYSKALNRLVERNSSMYVRNFIDDVSHGVAPYRETSRYTGGASFKFNIRNREVNHVLGALFSVPPFRDTYGADRTVTDFIRHTANRTVAYGEVVYELVSGDRTEFELIELPSESTYLSFGSWVQRLPKHLADQLGLPRVHALKQERIFHVTVPPPWHKSLGHTMNSLSRLASDSIFELVSQTLWLPEKRVHVDVKRISHARDIALAAVSKYTGWDPFAVLGNPLNLTSIHLQTRRLSFEMFLASLRGSIVAMIDRVLTWVGKALGLELTLSAIGFPTREKLESARSQLLRGTASWETVAASAGLQP